MISSVQGNVGWVPANHAPQVSPREAAGEAEHDGDADDGAMAVKTAAPSNLPGYMGSRIDTLA